jgi:hypothetical protein
MTGVLKHLSPMTNILDLVNIKQMKNKNCEENYRLD